MSAMRFSILVVGMLTSATLPSLVGCGRYRTDAASTMDADAASTMDAASATDAAGDNASSAAKCTATPRMLIGPFWLQAADAGSSVSSVEWAFGDVTVSAGSVYIAATGPTEGRVWQVPLDGGSYSTFIQTIGFEQALLPTESGLILAETRVASDGGLTGQVVLVSAAGGPATVLASTQGDVIGAVADSKFVYFADSSGTKRAPLTGGPATTLTARAGSLGLFAGNVVIADAKASEILGVAIDGGTVATLATGQAEAMDPLACGSALCWLTVGPTMRGRGVASIVRLDVPASAEPIVTSADLFSPSRVVFDGRDFFVAVGVDTEPSGPIVQVAASGGTPTLVANAETVGFAIDGDCLFWADPHQGVFSVKK
ncbi:MAG: hypothetical protein ABI548_07235 [Polyangiaceae bacterium]